MRNAFYYLILFFISLNHFLYGGIVEDLRDGFIKYINDDSSRKPLKNEDLQIKRIAEGEGSGNQGIFKITLADEVLIAKIPKNPKEIEKMRDLQPLVARLNAKQALPKLVPFRGSFKFSHNDAQYSVMLLNEAQGQTLDNYLKELKTKSPAEYLPHLKNIGEKLANFHKGDIKVFRDHYHKANVKGLSHGDISTHLGNIFYDGNNLIFIDYEAMKYGNFLNWEIEGLFRVLGRELSDSEAFLFTLINAYISEFPEGPIRTTVAKNVYFGAKTYAGKAIPLLDQMALKAEKTWNLLEKDEQLEIEGKAVEDARKKRDMGAFLQSQFESQLKDIMVDDVNDVLWNIAGDHHVYEIVGKENTFWVRKSQGVKDFEAHKNQQEEIEKLKSIPGLPMFLPPVKQISIVSDTNTEKAQKFLVFKNLPGKLLPEYMFSAIASMNTSDIKDHFFSIGRSIGLMNTTHSKLIEDKSQPEVHGLVHGELWTVDIIYQPESKTIGFIDYRYLGEGDVAKDARRFFAEMARTLRELTSKVDRGRFLVDRVYVYDPSITPLKEEYASKIEAIVYALVEGYLSAFENPAFRTILEPIIKESISVYLYNFAKANSKLEKLIRIIR